MSGRAAKIKAASTKSVKAARVISFVERKKAMFVKPVCAQPKNDIFKRYAVSMPSIDILYLSNITMSCLAFAVHEADACMYPTSDAAI